MVQNRFLVLLMGVTELTKLKEISKLIRRFILENSVFTVIMKDVKKDLYLPTVSKYITDITQVYIQLIYSSD